MILLDLFMSSLIYKKDNRYFKNQTLEQMAKLRRSTFEPIVGQRFVLHKPNGGTLNLLLESIDNAHPIEGYECFTLNFQAPEEESALPDNSYLVENDHLGQVSIFLSATLKPGPNPADYYYESIFNVYLGAYLNSAGDQSQPK